MKHNYTSGLQLKSEGESDLTEYYVEGFISDTLPDLVGDRVLCQAKLVEQINNLAESNKVTLHHDRADATVAAKLTGAELRDGKAYGYVQLNRFHPDFDKTRYEIENRFIDGFSIEYLEVDGQWRDNEHGGHDLYDIQMRGVGLASRAVNPRAEITNSYEKEKMVIPLLMSEDTNMAEKEVMETPVIAKEEAVEAPKEEIVEETTEAPAEETPKEEVSEEEPEVAAEEPVAAEEAKEDLALTEVEKKEILSSRKEKESNEMVDAILSNPKFKEAFNKVEVENKVLKNEAPAPKEAVHIKEFNEAIAMKDNKVSIKEQLDLAKEVCEKEGLYIKAMQVSSVPVEMRSDFNFKSEGPNGSALAVKEMKVKALETDTNSTTFVQSATELNDVYQPVIFNMLNDRTTTFGLLPKDDMSMMQMVQWRARNVRNASSGAYAEGAAITKGNTTRQKLETNFKYYAVGVQVTGQMIASARGSVGDIFNMEVQDATRDLLKTLNTDLHTEQGAETQTKVIGIPFVTDSTTNATLYGLTRSATNLLLSNNIAGGSAVITKAKLREAIRTAEINGADRGNLIFVTSYAQRDKVVGLYDSTQRQNNVSARFGFEGMATFDGVPIHADADHATTTEIQLIDLDSVRIGIQVPPTFETLAKSDDSESGFIKTYLSVYYKAPKRLVEITALT